MEGIQLSVEQSGSQNNISIIKVGGYIDTTTSSELDHHLRELIKNGSFNIIIDLGNVDYVSSAGWGIFISEIKGIRENGGDLKLVKMIPEVYEVFELLEFNHILKAFDSLKEAIEDFERNGAAPAPRRAVANELAQPVVPDVPNPVNLGTGASPQDDPTRFRRNTLEDNLRKIVADFPESGTTQIAKMLYSPKYGNMKIGWFKLRKILKNVNLDTKKKRRAHAARYNG